VRIRVNFERPEDICYIGHIDLKTAIERGLRRTLLPLKFTEGFNSRVKMETGFPLSVGMVGEDEYFDFYLKEELDIGTIKETLNSAFAGTIIIKDAKVIPDNSPSITSLDAILVHFVYGKVLESISDEEIENYFKKVLESSEIIIEREGKKKEIRKFIENLELLKREGENVEVLFSIYFTHSGSVRVDELLNVLKNSGLLIEFEYSVRKRTSVFYKGKIVSPFDF
jgi:radical SAM-linked protein